MLRRKPTALTISPEDLTAFEEAHAYNKALAVYKKTGVDPEGWFASHNDQQRQQQQQQQQYHQHQGSGISQNHHGVNMATAASTVDPNDELKPLPGDKARIVRSREERIVGVGNNNNNSLSASATGSTAATAGAGGGGVGGAATGTTNNVRGNTATAAAAATTAGEGTRPRTTTTNATGSTNFGRR